MTDQTAASTTTSTATHSRDVRGDQTPIDVKNAHFLQGRTVLVTGASSGIGEVTALHLASLGATVVCAARRLDRLRDLAERINSDPATYPGRAHAVELDVSDPDQVREVVHSVSREHGGLYAAFNNAGFTEESLAVPALRTSAAAFDRIVAVNMRGTWACIQAELDVMMPRGEGRVVNNSSVYSFGAAALSPIHCATKAAVDSFTNSFAMIAGPRGVTVNSVNPGYTIPSEMFRDVQKLTPGTTEQEAFEFISRDVPRRQMVSAWQIAHQVAYFMHPSSAMVTGQKVAVCGGLSVPHFNYLHIAGDRIADMQFPPPREQDETSVEKSKTLSE
eukprot:CAMPEP_0174236748 /NCGR_PEP_ID=MMETSP0417-20130205/5780_1 /TAXON_ID=242541 /ORGANISM="Mayorella sp, Strain BSH-02190019" /LENGTH=331 /DNA_ID=CAMNT_0015315431 /DNA_START=15 /DNA_END=1010 /DNA_ORIENTATION=+